VEDEMIVYFNNCIRREHERIYGSGAFYDLATKGYQATKANNLSVGQQCIVATPEKDGRIVFSWYEFLSEAVKLSENRHPCRVFFGKCIKSDTLSKGDAARHGLYSTFFDKNGNFKRQSVIRRY
jgi:hypothetical protein